MITKFIRKYLMNGYVSIPLMLCFILTTWSSIASNKKLTYHLSGEEMFKGVFFMEGKYAELIPELKATKLTYFSEQLSAEENAALQTVRNQLIESIKADNPHFFDDFKATLQVANPAAIKEELKLAQELLTKKAMELSNMSESELQKDTKAMSDFLKKQGNSKDKNALKKFVNDLDRDNAGSDNSGRLLVILIVIAAVVAVVWAWVKVYDAVEEEVSASRLMFEQVVGSICNVAPQIV
jgi:SdpC family antimicrobial peptide